MKRVSTAIVVIMVAILGWAGPAAAASGPQTFILYQGPGQDHFTVSASGPVSGIGTDFLLAEGVDPSTGMVQRKTKTVFPNGNTFNTLTVLSNSVTFDPVSCIAQIVGRSRLAITGGTGRFKGVTGHGEVTFRAITIFERTSEGCSRDAVATYLVAHITGAASVPDRTAG